MLVQLIKFTLNFEMFLPISHLLLVIYTSLLYIVYDWLRNVLYPKLFTIVIITEIPSATPIVCDWTNIFKDIGLYK